MIRIGIVLVTATCLAACGRAATHHPAQASTRPPAATLTSTRGTLTLATGSYCWSARSGAGYVGSCGDGPAPANMPDLPVVRVHAGETVVVRLGFTPTAPVEVTIGRSGYRVPAGSVLRLRLHRGGFLTLDPRRGHDDVQYVARIVMSA